MVHIARTIATRIIDASVSEDTLYATLHAVTQELGFTYFALTHHVDVTKAGQNIVHLHNYPEHWASIYNDRGYGLQDPVHRASHKRNCGFRWNQLPDIITLTKRDRALLTMCREQGIGNGFTIPANVPGEARGSVTFAITEGQPLPVAMLPLAQMAGNIAFEAARALRARNQSVFRSSAPHLTDRQRDCLLWIARGKTDWEISRILGVSEETVTAHIRQACERYDVNKRTSLLIRTIFDGTLSFPEIFGRAYPPFPE